MSGHKTRRGGLFRGVKKAAEVNGSAVKKIRRYYLSAVHKKRHTDSLNALRESRKLK
jgi:hypothetical protein